MNLLNIIKWGEVNEYTPLFDEIRTPSEINKETLINTIVYDNWDLEPMISDYMLLQKMINNFFEMKYDSYKRLAIALNDEYNALHNFDRFEIKKENRKLDKEDILTSSDIYNSNKNRDVNVESVNEDSVSASNSSVYQPRNKNITTENENDVEVLKDDRTLNDNRKVKDTEDYITDNHLYGNIGVTTSQQMLLSEVNLRMTTNIYKLISNDFRKEVMLLLM